MSGVRILAPAKLNLGLAVLGKRPDGYHEIDTIIAMIDLCDEIEIRQRAEPGITVHGMDDIPPEHNLIHRATMLWCATAGYQPAYEIRIQKRVPSPGGLGGGSSDAAATLRALNLLHDSPLIGEHLHELATKIGADCPFFLGDIAARARGIGTELMPVTPPHGAVVIIVPRVNVEAKTAKLYGALQSADFGTRADIDAIEAGLRNDQLQAEASLPNSFDRPVGELMPEVKTLRASLAEAGVEAHLTGAGPGLYVLATSIDDARRLHARIRDLVGANSFTGVASFLERTPQPELLP